MILAVIAGLAVVLSAPARTQSDGEETFGLPDEKGREEVIAFCSGCHSIRLVVQQGLTRAGWEELLQVMYDEQEMPQLEPGDTVLVLDYLTKHVGPDNHKQRLGRLR